MSAPTQKRRPLFDIAHEIRADWQPVNFAAEPYLVAMSTMLNVEDDYGYDSGPSVVLYFLSNARSWRGDTARRVKAELNRIVIITRDLIRLERRRAIDLSSEGVIGDKPSRVVETVAGIAGAGFGRSQARRLGVGGTVQIPGIMAQRFRELVAAGVNDPASRLIHDAVLDEKLFRELLMAPLEEEARRLSAPATARLQAWAAAVLAEHGAAVGGQDETQ